MFDNNTIPSEQYSFKDFLFKNRRNRITLILAAVSILIQFGVFKYFYPFASYIHGDSFSYLNAAERNLDINTYPIGYSKFLRLFSVFNRTDYVLTAFQYLFIQCSAVYFLFTIFYFYKIGRVTQITLLCIIVLNPLFLHLGNLISSDGIFLALSLTWMTLLLWLINKPSNTIIAYHSIVLFIAFTFRYNAMIYPIISLLAFYLSNMPVRKKILGLSLAATLIISFVSFTMYKYKKLTGYWQYSPFSGWQLTNNALYTYRYVDSADRKPVAKKYVRFDNMIRQYFDSTRDTKKFPFEAIKASTFYMWSRGQPMFSYREELFKNDSGATEFKKWASMGPYFKDYGLYIIKRYPWHFVQNFIWPNAQKYFAPPIEFLQTYNSGKKGIDNETKNWFGYASNKLSTRTKDGDVLMLEFYPIQSGIINVVMLCCLLCYIFLTGWRYDNSFKNLILIGGSFWLLNACFTISASSAALRFQSFPLIVSTILAAILLDWMFQVMTLLSRQEKMPKHESQNIQDGTHQFLIR